MNETSIPEKPLQFEYRTDINQFLRDGETITALYDLTLQLLYSNFSNTDEAKSKMLRIFNSAYHFCWLATEKHLGYEEIKQEMKKSDNGKRHVLFYGVAWSILRLHCRDYNPELPKQLRQRLTELRFGYLFRPYLEFVETEDHPDIQLSLRSPVVSGQQERAGESRGQVPGSSVDPGGSGDRYVTRAESAGSRTCPQTLPQILNWETIGDYALSLGNAQDVHVIYVMLNRISTRNRYFDESLNKVIEKIERHQHALEQHKFGATFNFNEGSSYNDIHDNTDSTIKTNG